MADYNNINFTIFRDMLPFMEGARDPGPAARAAAADRLFITYVQRQVFDPVHVTDARCAPARDAMLMYPPPAAGSRPGKPAPVGPSACSSGGWFMTPASMRRVLDGLISGTSLLSGSQRQQMDDNCLGWDWPATTGWHEDYFPRDADDDAYGEVHPYGDDDQEYCGRCRRAPGRRCQRTTGACRRWMPPMPTCASSPRQVLAMVDFQGGPGTAELMRALTILRQLNASGGRKVPDDAPAGFVPRRYADYLTQARRSADVAAYRHYWELCVLLAVRDGLRSGDIYVPGSRRYADPSSYLFTPAQ